MFSLKKTDVLIIFSTKSICFIYMIYRFKDLFFKQLWYVSIYAIKKFEWKSPNDQDILSIIIIVRYYYYY